MEDVFEILWHGRGGQGAFTAARLLGAAASYGEGSYALAFPSFGPERRGAPMRAFTKIGARPLGDRSAVEHADVAIYLDDTLLGPDFADELKPGGSVLLNTVESYDDSRISGIDASGIALAQLGRNIVNTVLLGAFAAHTDIVSPDHIERSIREYLPPKLHDGNIAAFRAAFETAGGKGLR